MSRFLLDTNVVIALLKTAASPLSERVRSQPSADVEISSVSVFELYFGAYKSASREKNLANLDRLGLKILPFTADDARHSGEIRAVLGVQGTPIGPYDLLIAGQARARDLILVTSNVREFRRVKGLLLEDWLET